MTAAFRRNRASTVGSSRCGTHAERGAKQKVLQNVHSIEKTATDQDPRIVGGDGFEPPTPAW